MRNVKVAQLKPPTCQYCRLLGLCTLPVMHYLKSHELVPGIALHRSYYYHKYECSIFFVLILLVSNNVYFSFSLPAVNTAVCSLPVMCKTFCAIPELSRLQSGPSVCSSLTLVCALNTDNKMPCYIMGCPR